MGGVTPHDGAECMVCHARTGLEHVTYYPPGWTGRVDWICSEGDRRWTTCQLVILRRERMHEREGMRIG